MNIKYLVAIAGVVSLLISGQAWSQDNGENDEGEVTIRLMGHADAALPDAVTKNISLPVVLPADAAAEAAAAISSAEAARAAGLEKAEIALDRNAAMRQNALENVENRSRSDVPSGPPTDPPQPPGPPDGN